jgi:hypothetical protein
MLYKSHSHGWKAEEEETEELGGSERDDNKF